MNFRDERRTPSHGAVPKRAAAPRPGRTPTEIALGSDRLSGQTPIRGDPHPVRHSAICSEPAGEAAGASPRRTFKVGHLICPAPPGGWKRSHGRRGASHSRALDVQKRVGSSASVVAGKTTEERTSRTSSTAWQSCRRPSSQELTSSAPSRASSTAVAPSRASIFGLMGAYLSQSRRTNIPSIDPEDDPEVSRELL